MLASSAAQPTAVSCHICSPLASRLDQAVRLRSLPGLEDSLLVDGQLPSDQARARAAGLVKIADYLKHVSHRNWGHLADLKRGNPRTALASRRLPGSLFVSVHTNVFAAYDIRGQQLLAVLRTW